MRRGYVFPSLVYQLVLLTGMVFFLACQPESDSYKPSDLFPIPIPESWPEMVIPENNQLSPGRISLGRNLFYDPVLSRDSTVSCATCHDQAAAFAQNEIVPTGIDGRLGKRNTPTLANIGFHPYYLREGGVPTLEQQVAVPVQEHAEFDFSFPEIVSRLQADQKWVDQCLAAYGREPDAFCVTRALGAFQRTLISANSPFDRYFRDGEVDALSPAARRGYTVFTEAGCDQCHSGFDFTDYQFHNIGLYAEYLDPGRERLTGLAADRGRFKTPTLRNVAVTAPYMHDGSLSDLEAVIAHFNTGGVGHANQSELVRPLALSPQEQSDLMAFLESLTDPSFLTEPAYAAPR